MKTKLYEMHSGQLPTTRWAIREQLTEFNRCIPAMIIQCILHENDDGYHNYLARAADHLEMLSRFVYFGKDKKCKKPSAALYKKELFEGMAETPDEVASCAHDVHETLADKERTHKILWQIADLVCEMMAVSSEHAFVDEYAYAIDYVIKHHEGLPKPEMDRIGLFPKNYKDYHYGTFYDADWLRPFI